MNIWFLSKIKYQKQEDDGKIKAVNEFYLFEAVSYTDAETRTFEYFEGANLVDFEVANISKLNVQEVFLTDADNDWWFKVRVQFIIYDERTKKDKKVPQLMLINAKDIVKAYEKTKTKLGDLDDYIISDINVTKIEEVLALENLGTTKVPENFTAVKDLPENNVTGSTEEE